MKHFILLAFITISAITSEAVEYRILKLNTATITINGNELTVGDRFSDSDIIQWKPSQVMKVETDTHQQRVLRAIDFKKSKSRNIREYLVNARNLSVQSANRILTTNTPLSTRDFNLSTTEAHQEYMSNTFLLWDSLVINTCWKTDTQNYFTISYCTNGQTTTNKIPADTENRLIITRDMFPDINDETPVKCTVSYIEEGYGDITPITSDMNIILINTTK